jgi:putative DNA-invertase from lambdoid prophage Rac
MKSLRVAIYVRVSTTHQSAEMQLEPCEAMARHRGWEVVATFRDEGFSGRTAKRPGLRKMLDRARRGDFDVIIVYKLDRIFRSIVEFANLMVELDTWRVRFMTATQPIDTDDKTPIGNYVRAILSAVAELESELARERTRDGVANARRKGKPMGRPKRSVDRLAALELLDKGWSVRRAARRLKVPKSTLYRALAPELEQRAKSN